MCAGEALRELLFLEPEGATHLSYELASRRRQQRFELQRLRGGGRHELQRLRGGGFAYCSVPAARRVALARTSTATAVRMEIAWSDPAWAWGSAKGEAHLAAAKLRASLDSVEAREAFLSSATAGEESMEDCTLALALLLQKATKKCYASRYGLEDEEDQVEWKELLEMMVEGQFEGGQRGEARMVEAIGERVGLSERARLSSLCALSGPRQSIVSVLKALAFVDQGV